MDILKPKKIHTKKKRLFIDKFLLCINSDSNDVIQTFLVKTPFLAITH